MTDRSRPSPGRRPAERAAAPPRPRARHLALALAGMGLLLTLGDRQAVAASEDIILRPILGMAEASRIAPMLPDPNPAAHEHLFRARPSSRVLAAAGGTVAIEPDTGCGGQRLTVHHGDGVTTSYRGLGQLDVAAGQEVMQGQLLGFTPTVRQIKAAKAGAAARPATCVAVPGFGFSVAVDGTAIAPAAAYGRAVAELAGTLIYAGPLHVVDADTALAEQRATTSLVSSRASAARGYAQATTADGRIIHAGGYVDCPPEAPPGCDCVIQDAIKQNAEQKAQRAVIVAVANIPQPAKKALACLEQLESLLKLSISFDFFTNPQALLDAALNQLKSFVCNAAKQALQTALQKATKPIQDLAGSDVMNVLRQAGVSINGTLPGGARIAWPAIPPTLPNINLP